MILGVGGPAEVREEINDVGLATLDRVDRPDNDLRRASESLRTAQCGDVRRKLDALTEFRRQMISPPAQERAGTF